ncbi:bifunctional adenosylcobinamide kinase/adenosylcobinamide-phosphate guanylyltransferase [Ureibacillus sp. 179-F W5.1 NHS]|uniref:Adenosylcobinamide kinase n=1 Tax=Lysinibacillus halotolerans TaxID=1368476 RepID=A0A3M8H724_9BACI|nr:bifunctional adenosylcobinamide kinase/adenosylcobinamide-phosphate guanylyltransferase [Lysinibacillus halotolerans]RNC98205.1 bifunctional adenosylcobinamide kinase/adenosylcobinamide-phosphate guanylyltransferase [Lysinibacillus halotolerans]
MGKIIFITGGVRSGKSAFAERYAKQLFQIYDRKRLLYIASGVAIDEEMAERIKRHQQDRFNSSVQWETIEIVDDLVFNDELFAEHPIVVWDCLTTWLNNVLYKTELLNGEARTHEINRYIQALKEQVLKWKEVNDCILLLVSNELLDEAQSKFSEVNRYCSLLGKMHQWIVEKCDEAYEMDYSLRKRWK